MITITKEDALKIKDILETVVKYYPYDIGYDEEIKRLVDLLTKENQPDTHLLNITVCGN